MNLKPVISVTMCGILAGCGSEVQENQPVQEVQENQPVQQVDTQPQEQVAQQSTILELMTSQIVPLTNELWGIDEPQTDDEWNAYQDVADDTIAAFEQMRQGGSGPMDIEWAADPRWTEYSTQAIRATEQFKEAISAQDMEMIWEAGDALLDPCTKCHEDFNPAVAGQ